MAKLEIEARFSDERHRFGECGIASTFLLDSSRELAVNAGFPEHGHVMTVKGDYDEGELQPGMSYRFFGMFSKYKNKRTGQVDLQFRFTSFVPIVSHDEDGVVAYLEAAGRGNGMGIGTARKAWQEWGSDAVRIVREQPRRLLELNKRLSDEQLLAIGAKLRDQQKTEAATIEITNLLHGRGFPKALPRTCIKQWGNRAAMIVKKDPYRLLKFRGCGFKTCDRLYLELGLDPKRLRRQTLCGWYAISSDSGGNVWHPVEKVRRAIEATVGRDADPERAIELGERLGRLAPGHYGALATIRTAGMRGPISPVGDRVWVAEGRMAEQEDQLARMLQHALHEDRPQQITMYEQSEREELHYLDHVRCHRCSRQLTAPEVHVWAGKPFGPTCIQSISGGEDVEVVSLQDWMQSHPVVKRIIEERPSKLVDLPAYSLWPEVDRLEIDDHQRSELAKALVGRVAIFGGSPGTGKTYTVAQLVRHLLRSGISPEDIAIGAPTGKAAVRVTENLAGLPVRARTWHSLLGMGECDADGNVGFLHGRHNPWDYRVIIGDETSMVDLSLMCAIFAARPRGCHVLLVGDIHQLSPVVAGAPLRDMIAAGVPYGELTEIWRNSGGIVEACAAIRDGRPWNSGDNLHVLGRGDPEVQMDTVERILDRCSANNMDPVWDAQVLCAVNLRSKISRAMVNARLQGHLNHNPAIPGSPFRVGDKVVCTQNGFYSLTNPDFADGLDAEAVDSEGRVYVANGELAKVLSVESNKLIAELYNPPREIVIPRGKASSENESEGDDEKEGGAGTGCKFDLAYALSVHKSQGSEWAVAIPLIDEYPGAKQVCDRSWLYTAISRGKEKVFLVGDKSTADSMCRRNNMDRRKTFLREKIQLLHAEKVLELI